MLIVISYLWLHAVQSVHAQSGGIAESRLIAKSTTGKTVMFNVGELDQLKVGDYAVVMRRVKPQDLMAIRIVPVARGRVVRAGKNRSLWYLYDLKDSSQLILRDKYLLTTETLSLKGRRSLESGRQAIIAEKNELPDVLENKKEGDKDLLSLRKNDYLVIKKNHKLGEGYTQDGQLHDVGHWMTLGKDGKSKFAQSLWKSPYEQDFAEQKRLETFEKLVNNYLVRVNDPAFNYGDFYWQQTRDSSGEFRTSASSQTEYMAFKDEEQKSLSKDTELYRELLNKGQSWSADYSDEELSEMMNRVGIIYEQERRRSATIRSYEWQLTGQFGLNFLDNENRIDGENTRSTKWGLEVAGEWFPAAKHEKMQQLSLWSGLRYVEDGVSVGDLNAQSTEYSLSLGGTWHFLHSPFAVDRNIPFIGFGVRTGFVTLETETTGEEANYDMFSFPALMTGIKYNFRRGLGLRVAFGFERLVLEQTEANAVTTNLPQKKEILEGRLNIGITKFY